MNGNLAITRRDFLCAAGIAAACFHIQHCFASAVRCDEPAKASPTNARGLNPRFTFDSFVAGRGNGYALWMAWSVVHWPGTACQRLFVHGEAGVGKTHLLHAIGNEVCAANSSVLCMTGEGFWNEFIDAIRNGALAEFRRRLRAPDLLLIDDIKFFSAKKRWPEELLHTFTCILATQKRLVLSSKTPLEEDAVVFDQRHVSRCHWGVRAEIRHPDASAT